MASTEPKWQRSLARWPHFETRSNILEEQSRIEHRQARRTARPCPRLAGQARPMSDARPHHELSAAISGERWLGPTILRVASWPIESLDGLRSAQLCKQIDDWIDDEEAIRGESDRLAAALHKIVPQLVDRTIRRLALELKRKLHGSLEPLPERL